MYRVQVVENGVQALDVISTLETEGFGREDVYIFAHDERREEDLSDATATAEVGVKEQGMFESVGNMFKSRGDELRSKMESLGLTKQEAEKYEKELDEGRLVVVGSKNE